jgi:hypothetical protein
MAGPHPPTDAPRPPIRRRSWAEIRWRQFRNAPRPVVRAVLSSLVVAVVLGTAYLVYDVALSRGASLPGGDLRVAAVALYIAVVLVSGSLVTYLVVPQPTGSGGRSTRTPWSAALGFFNSEEEIGRFANAVELLASHTPDSLPPRQRLTILGQGDS